VADGGSWTSLVAGATSMRKKYLLFALMFFFVLDHGTAAIAKEKNVASKNAVASNKEKVDNRPLVSFDINVEKLPPDFKGVDIAKLFTLLSKKAPLKKEEFETTAEYEKKVRAAITDDIYAFKLDTDISPFFSTPLVIHPYDADTQKLRIDIIMCDLSESNSRVSVVIKDVEIDRGSYVGSNAFGVKVLVHTATHIQYGIALVNQQVFYLHIQDPSFSTRMSPTYITATIQLEIPPEKARRLKNNIGVILLCKPSLYVSTGQSLLESGNSLVFRDRKSSKATIDSPYSDHTDRSFINVEVLSIWIYEINTGSILLKQELKN
jgi:hypothetical protein